MHPHQKIPISSCLTCCNGRACWRRPTRPAPPAPALPPPAWRPGKWGRGLGFCKPGQCDGRLDVDDAHPASACCACTLVPARQGLYSLLQVAACLCIAAEQRDAASPTHQLSHLRVLALDLQRRDSIQCSAAGSWVDCRQAQAHAHACIHMTFAEPCPPHSAMPRLSALPSVHALSAWQGPRPAHLFEHEADLVPRQTPVIVGIGRNKQGLRISQCTLL